MKKLFLLLALAGVMVACGDKKENKKDEAAKANTENVEKDQKGAEEANPVDALVEKAVKAIQADDYAAIESIDAEYQKLSKEDQAKFDDAFKKAMM